MNDSDDIWVQWCHQLTCPPQRPSEELQPTPCWVLPHAAASRAAACPHTSSAPETQYNLLLTPQNCCRRHCLQFGVKPTLPQILHSYVLRSPMVVCVGWPASFKLADANINLTDLQICKYQSEQQFTNMRIWNYTGKEKIKEYEPRPRPLPRRRGCAYLPKLGQCFFSCFRRPWRQIFQYNCINCLCQKTWKHQRLR